MNQEQLQLTDQDGIGVITICGSLDLAIIPDLKSRIEPFIRDQHPRLLVNINDVSYIDSSGIGLLIFIAKIADEVQAQVKFIIPAGFVFDVLHMVHFDKLFEVYRNEEKAFKAFGK